MDEWTRFGAIKLLSQVNEMKIAFVGKYLDLKESYKSLTEALIHAGAHLRYKSKYQMG